MTPADLTDAELDVLEARAEAATPGPWYRTGNPWFRDCSGVLAGSPDGNISFMIADCEAMMQSREEYEGPFKLADAEADAAHIASMDPQTTLRLVAELRRRRATGEGGGT